jgi:predicted metalloprotease with PDZ domain
MGKTIKKYLARLHDRPGAVKISYDVKAVVPFVGNVYLDETRGYITPGGLFMYLDQELRHPVTIQMKPYSKWNNLVATGLDTIPGKYHVYKADDFDVLYDSPFLMGELEVLPPFTLKTNRTILLAINCLSLTGRVLWTILKKIVNRQQYHWRNPLHALYLFIDRCRWRRY